MVLDIFDQERNLLVFKNTIGNDKKFKIKLTHPNAPEELFFVHIDVLDIDKIPSQEQRQKSLELNH